MTNLCKKAHTWWHVWAFTPKKTQKIWFKTVLKWVWISNYIGGYLLYN